MSNRKPIRADRPFHIYQREMKDYKARQVKSEEYRQAEIEVSRPTGSLSICEIQERNRRILGRG